MIQLSHRAGAVTMVFLVAGQQPANAPGAPHDVLNRARQWHVAIGRTGPMFACDAEGVAPDLMALAKGLTSGYAPMGALLMSDAVYAGIADGAPAGASIGHGATYSAHPVSAAVALEVLRIYGSDEGGGLLAHARTMAPHFAQGLGR